MAAIPFAEQLNAAWTGQGMPFVIEEQPDISARFRATFYEFRNWKTEAFTFLAATVFFVIACLYVKVGTTKTTVAVQRTLLGLALTLMALGLYRLGLEYFLTESLDGQPQPSPFGSVEGVEYMPPREADYFSGGIRVFFAVTLMLLAKLFSNLITFGLLPIQSTKSSRHKGVS